MSTLKRKPLIRSVLKSERRGRDQTTPAKDASADDVKLLQDIFFQMEHEKLFGNFDPSRLDKQKFNPAVEKDDVRPDAKKRPAPKHNKALKEAEQMALQKPLTPGKYRQIMNDHLEVLPLVCKKMDKNTSS